jgi:hypothetical protein
MTPGDDHSDGKVLDEELAGLLEVETFEPPAEFREHALLNDPAVYEQAARARLVRAVGAGARRR